MSREIEECLDKAFYAFGTAAIFIRRSNSLRTKRTILTFFGIIGPILIGAAASAFGVDSVFVKILILIAGVVCFLQLGFFAWALVSGWDGKFEYAIESAQSNNELFTEFETLAKRSTDDISKKLEVLLERNRAQEARDMKAGISEKEKRFAMRSALMQFRKKCSSCGLEPKSSKPLKCDVCGNF